MVKAGKPPQNYRLNMLTRSNRNASALKPHEMTSALAALGFTPTLDPTPTLAPTLTPATLPTLAPTHAPTPQPTPPTPMHAPAPQPTPMLAPMSGFANPQPTPPTPTLALTHAPTPQPTPPTPMHAPTLPQSMHNMPWHAPAPQPTPTFAPMSGFANPQPTLTLAPVTPQSMHDTPYSHYLQPHLPSNPQLANFASTSSESSDAPIFHDFPATTADPSIHFNVRRRRQDNTTPPPFVASDPISLPLSLPTFAPVLRVARGVRGALNKTPDSPTYHCNRCLKTLTTTAWRNHSANCVNISWYRNPSPLDRVLLFHQSMAGQECPVPGCRYITRQKSLSELHFATHCMKLISWCPTCYRIGMKCDKPTANHDCSPGRPKK